ncbi:hypothetical protein BH11PLA2_BH11PLA2_09540 [soil metagenome]
MLRTMIASLLLACPVIAQTRDSDSPVNKEDPAVLKAIKDRGCNLFWPIRSWNLAEEPWVQLSLGNLYPKEGEAKELTDADFELIGKIKSLQKVALNGTIDPEATLKRFATMKSIVAFNIRNDSLTDAGVKILAGMPLKQLQLDTGQWSAVGLSAIGDSKTIVELTLRSQHLYDAETMGKIFKMPSLTHLNFSTDSSRITLGITPAEFKKIIDVRLPYKTIFSNELMTDDVMQSLVKQGHFYGPKPNRDATYLNTKPSTARSVQTLSFMFCKQLTDRGLAPLLDCVNVRRLDLSDTQISDETLKGLAPFEKLSSLNCSQTKVTGSGLAAMTKCPLEYVLLHNCSLCEEAFKVLGQQKNLKELGLGHAKMEASWLQHLSGLKELNTLHLNAISLSDDVKVLAGISSLNTLYLNESKLTDAGFQQLLQLPKLKKLVIYKTAVSKDAILKAKASYPKVVVSSD